MVSLKLAYEKPTGRVLGAQAVGGRGIDKRIDVIAMAIQLGATVYDLEQAELAYAPPFGSAKDPVNMIGFLAANALRGLTRPIHCADLERRQEDSAVTLLDVRTRTEFSAGAIPSALNVPLEQLRERIADVPNDRPVVTYCKLGQRGYIAERILRQNGYQDVRNLSGGLVTWQHFHPGPRPGPPGASGPSPSHAQPHSAARGAAQGTASAASAGGSAAQTLDARGLSCPGPLMAVADRVATMTAGQRLRVLASDPGFANDVAAWCRSQGHTLLESGPDEGHFFALIQTGSDQPASEPSPAGLSAPGSDKGQTIVVFSGDLDRVLAAFVIANGAAAMGHPVTMFFTFWGLNALRKERPPTLAKGLLDRMFGWMMPRGPNKLTLSKMNMGGLGTAMMKYRMRQKQVASLPKLIDDARRQGVKLVACTMSMDVMGIQPEELADGLELGGVGAYIGDAQAARMNLFI
jgi:peroxiredoxin family protein/rhodanese-related sulfurtransferase/TusA-related sulfurtransferase